MKTIFNTSKKKKLLAQESRVGMFFVNSWLIFFALISLIPMAWLLLAPSKTDEEVVNNAPLSFGNFKGYFNAWNNLRFFDDGVIQQWVVNSVVFNIAIVIIATATASLAGFVLSASRIRFKRVWLISTLIMMLIPPVALVVPLFVLMDQVGLVDNPLSVILISSLYPFGTFLSYIYYSTTIPPELYESARLDGCTDWQLYSKIAFPLSGALISLLDFFAFIGNWANYFLPYILLYSSENYTLPLGLGFLFNSTPAINPGVGATSVPIYKPEIALAGVLVALPILIVFLMSQRRLVKGMLAGSIKE
jgi:multiple sugar transport system permease protein